MPVITLNRERFSKILGKTLSVEEMVKWLPWIGVDLEEIGENDVKIEFNPNRIDFCSYVGVARALKGFLGLEKEQPLYNVKKGNITVNVDEKVSKVRPCIVAAVVKNIKLDDEDVRELMEMQEDLHWGIGRNRKKASIGVHNLDKVQPPFTYTAVEPTAVKFVPLDKTEEMTPQEILEKHEKGITFRSLIDWSPLYPLLIDRNKKVLSLPPIINGELTRVDSNTKNLFIDVTGVDYEAVTKSLNVLTTALNDMGGIVESVKVNYPNHSIITPDLSPQKMRLRVSYANRLLGLKLSEKRAIQCLSKCRMTAKKVEKDLLEVSIPPYRTDILHEVDLVEEIAIGYAYYKLRARIPQTITFGKPHEASTLVDKVSQIMRGLRFTEVINFILSNEDTLFRKMRIKPRNVLKIANPVSIEYSILRQELLPGLMKNLSENKHKPFPQQLFEVSDVIVLNKKAETRSERRLHVAAVNSYAAANFTEIKSYFEALLSNLNLTNAVLRETDHPSFISGRVATIQIKNQRIGIIGEIHPEVLCNFELENPVSAFELDLEWLLQT